jgi:hypothetical protein
MEGSGEIYFLTFECNELGRKYFPLIGGISVLYTGVDWLMTTCLYGQLTSGQHVRMNRE